MIKSSISRRHWIGSALATCGLFAAGGLLRAETAPVPKGYTRPGPVTERGLAPGLQAKVIHQGPTGETTYLVILDDVWKVDDAEAFLVDVPPARLLITARTREVLVSLGAEEHWADALSPSDALRVLAEWTGEKRPGPVGAKSTLT